MRRCCLAWIPLLALLCAAPTLAAEPAAARAPAYDWDRPWLVAMQLAVGTNKLDGTNVGLKLGAINLGDDDDTTPLVGWRHSLLIGRDPTIWGLDTGLFNLTTRELRGLQVGLINANQGDARGAVVGLSNWTEERMDGFQAGGVNVINGKGRSLQIGLINSANDLEGVQLGLLNLNLSGGPLAFFPLINVGW